jgi:hypothetical protein
MTLRRLVNCVSALLRTGEGALLSTIIKKEVIRTFDTTDEVLHTLVRCFGIVVISDSDSKDDASRVDFHFL